MRALLSLCALGALTVLPSCSSKTANGSVNLITGGESDVFSRAPAPATLAVDAIDLGGNTTSMLRAPLTQGTTVDLGDSKLSTVASIRVTGLDDTGVARVWGLSLPLQLGALDGQTLDLFVQRTGELARMPSPLGDARESPLVAAAGGRYVLVTGGADPALATTTQVYDVGTWSTIVAPPAFPRTPRSIAVVGLVVLVVDDAGAAWFDLSSGEQADAISPTGGTFAEVAGGDTIVAPDGTAYIVGATRPENPTARVLRVNADGSILSFITLNTPRAGAAAGWVDERGLVIAGGSTDGAGVEIVAAGAKVSLPLAYPADATKGAALARIDAGHALLVGGTTNGADAGVRTIDLGCSTACAAGAAVPLPAKLTRASLFARPAGTLAVGEDDTGATHAYRVDAKGAADVPLKLPRKHARGVVTPIGTIAIVGGDKTIESFAF